MKIGGNLIDRKLKHQDSKSPKDVLIEVHWESLSI